MKRARLHSVLLRLVVLCLCFCAPAAAQGFAPPRFFDPGIDEPAADVKFDPVHKLILASYPQANKVLIISSETMTLVRAVALAAPVGIDFFPGYELAVVGSGNTNVGVTTDFFYIVNVVTGEVVDRRYGGDLTQPGEVVDVRQPVACSNGDVLFASDFYTHKVMRFNADSATITPLGVGDFTFNPDSIARTGDWNRVVISKSNKIGYYDCASRSMLNSADRTSTGNNRVVVSPDGSRVLDGTELLDGSFNLVQHNVAPCCFSSALFTPDGSKLLLFRQTGQRYIDLFDAITGARLGYLPDYPRDVHFFGLPGQLDLSAVLFGQFDHGIISYTLPVSAPLPSPLLQGVGIADVIGAKAGSIVKVDGAGFIAGMSVFLDATPIAVNVLSSNQFTFTAPPGAGTHNLTVVLPNGDRVFASRAFSYGPNIQWIEPPAGTTEGGNTVMLQLSGAGAFGTTTSVSFNGLAATVLIGVAPADGSSGTIRVQVPPGVPGPATITVSSPFGSNSFPAAYQYYSSTPIPLADIPEQLIADLPRQRIYAISRTGRLDAFALSNFAPLEHYESNLLVLGSLKPDGSSLMVSAGEADIQEIGLDPFHLIRSTPYASFKYDPKTFAFDVVPTSLGSSFVAFFYPEMVGARTIFNDNIWQLNEVDASGGAHIRTGDTNATGYIRPLSSLAGDRVAFSPTSYWTAATNQIKPSVVSTESDYLVGSSGLEVLADAYRNYDRYGRVQSLSTRSYAGIQSRACFLFECFMPGEKLDPGGSYSYVPELTFGTDFSQFSIFSTSTGARLTTIGLPRDSWGSIDNALIVGSDAYLVDSQGLTKVALPVLPLSVGSILPSTVSTAGGTSITITGYGFKSGIAASFQNIAVPVTFISSAKIVVPSPIGAAGYYKITLTNPGEPAVTSLLGIHLVDTLPQPLLFWFSPSSADVGAGSGPLDLVIRGENFIQGAIASWNGQPRPTQWIDHDQLMMQVTADDLALPGTYAVAVFNPGTGAESAPKDFVVAAPILKIIPEFSRGYNAQLIGTESQPQWNLIRNGGNVDIPINLISVSGAFLLKATDCGTVIHREDICALSISFKPATVGDNHGSIDVAGVPNLQLTAQGIDVTLSLWSADTGKFFFSSIATLTVVSPEPADLQLVCTTDVPALTCSISPALTNVSDSGKWVHVTLLRAGETVPPGLEPASGLANVTVTANPNGVPHTLQFPMRYLQRH